MKYIIQKAKHYCNFTIDRLQPFAKQRTGKFMIPKQNWYDRSVVKNPGWNKLIGITGLGIHTNSGRLVWQPDFDLKNVIRISGYVYSNGVRSEKHLCTIQCDKWYDFRVAYNNGWVFQIDNYIIKMDGKKPNLMLKTFAYFGGKDKAYKEMIFNFK